MNVYFHMILAAFSEEPKVMKFLNGMWEHNSSRLLWKSIPYAYLCLSTVPQRFPQSTQTHKTFSMKTQRTNLPTQLLLCIAECPF